jgi:hypothetical protein
MATDLSNSLAALDSTLDSALDAAATVPFLKGESGLLDAKTFIDGVTAKIQTALSPFQDPTSAALDQQLETVVETGLYKALGPDGLGIVKQLTDIAVNITGDAPDNNLRIGVEMPLRQTWTLIQSPNLMFDLGLPALPIQATAAGGVQVSVGFAFELKFGYDAATSTFSLATNTDLQNGGAQLNLPQDPSHPYDLSKHLFAVEAQASLVNFSAGLDVGFLGGSVKDIGDNSNPDLTKHTALEAALVIDDLANLTKVSLLGEADVNLALDLGVTDGNGGPLDPKFPDIGTNLALHWDFNDNSAPQVAFNDVRFSLGALFSDVITPQFLTYVQDFTKPLQPLFDLLKARLPVLSDVVGHDLSLESLLEAGASQGLFGQYSSLVDLATNLVDITTFVNQISADGDQVMIDVGNFDVGGGNVDLRDMGTATLPAVLKMLDPDQITTLTDPQKWQSVLDNVGSVTTDIKDQLDAIQNNHPNSPEAFAAHAAEQLLPGSGNTATVNLNFPFFDDPANGVFQILLGQDPDLMSFTAQFKLAAQEDANQLFGLSELPGITFDFTNQVNLDAYFKAAYDTYGIREFVHDALNGQVKPLDILNGFYLATDDSNNPDHPAGCHLNLSGDISVGPKLNLVVFQAGVSGGISADLHLWASDPNGTGKFHLNDVLNNGLQAADHLFNASGDVEASLTAFIKVGVEVLGKFVGYEKDFDLASVKLIDFGTSSITGNPYQPPPDLQLATPDPKDPSRLLLNMGQRAKFLTKKDPALRSQTDVSFTVTHDSDTPNGGEVLSVSAFGFQQQFGMATGIKTIVVDGLDGNDVITIGKSVRAGAEITEGNGNDQIQYLGTGNALIDAGDGNDLIQGGSGYNHIRTGSGNSTLVGGDGSTAITPPPVVWGQATTPNGTLYVNDIATGSGFGGNLLQGGSGLDHLVAAGHGQNKLIAGKQDDYLEGDGGFDTFVAGAGHDTVHLAGGTNTVEWTVGDGNLDVQTNDVLSSNALQVSGSNGPDTFGLAPNGDFGGLDVQADATLVHWVGFIDTVSIDGAGGHDTTNIADMENSWVSDIGLNDGEALSPDGSADVVNVQGSPNSHAILVKTESAFLHQDGPIGGVMLVQTHPHYKVHVAVAGDGDTLNVFAKGANNTIDVQSNTGHTVIFGDAGSDTYNVSSDAPADTGVLLDPPPQQQRPPFGLFGMLDLHAGPGNNSLVVSESGSTQSDHVTLTNRSISGGPLHSFNPVSGLPVTMNWRINYDAPANGDFAGGIRLETGSAADTVRVWSTPTNVPVIVRTAGGGDRITVGDPGQGLDAIGGTVTVDGGDGTAVVTFDDRNAGGPEIYQIGFSQLVGNFMTRGNATFVYRNVGEMVLDAGLDATVDVLASTAGTGVRINLGGGASQVTVGSVAESLATIRGPVSVRGRTGKETLVLDDLNGPFMTSYAITGTSIDSAQSNTVRFQNIGAVTLEGGPGVESYTVTAVGRIPIAIVARGVSNILSGPNRTNHWLISGTNAGILDGVILFSGIQSLIGGSVNDTFAYSATGSLTGSIIGRAPSSLATIAGFNQADMTVHADIALLPNQSLTLFARYDAASDSWYGAELVGTANGFIPIIYRRKNGVMEVLATGSPIASASGTLAFKVTGTSLDLILNNTSLIIATDGELMTGGAAVQFGPGVSIDGFGVS